MQSPATEHSYWITERRRPAFLAVAGVLGHEGPPGHMDKIALFR
jgi:hypothetical protein